MTELQSQLFHLEESKVITTPEKNLRSKIDSIIRSLENLSEKKVRIDYEIKKQKRTLARKRQELKKVSKSNQARISVALESGNLLDPFETEEDKLLLQKLDSKLLQKSDQVLDS